MYGSGSPHVVSDVMTQTVVSVGQDAPFKDIVALMNQWQVSAVPVTAGEGRVVGVVSEADLLPKEEFRDQRTQPPRTTAPPRRHGQGGRAHCGRADDRARGHRAR